MSFEMEGRQMRDVNQKDWGRLFSLLQRPGIVVGVDVEDLKEIHERGSKILEGGSRGDTSHGLAANQALATLGSFTQDERCEQVLVVLESRTGNLVVPGLREIVALVRKQLQVQAVLLVAAVVPEMCEDARVAIIF